MVRYGKQLINLTGQRFGRLTVLSRAENDKRGNAQWLCQCDCGNQKIIRGYSLKGGTSFSCGCLKQEKLSELRYVHGKTPTRLYNIWQHMKKRCLNPREPYYYNYGGRGITICDEWKNDFVSFRDWAFSNGYDETLSIDRIDNDKGYSPQNCRWVTALEQNNNTRKNHYVTYQGKTQTIAQWSKELGYPHDLLRYRLTRGWPVEKALTTPARKLNKKK